MAYATWNPSDKNADITLSGSDLIATMSTGAAYRSLRATHSKTSGKYYWEISIGVAGASGTHVVGVANSSAGLAARIGADANGWGYRASGKKDHSGSSVSYGDSYGAGDVIGVALDMTSGKVWFSKNGTWQNSGDPAAGTGEAYSGLSGALFPADTLYITNDQQTADFGASAFSYSVPSGFQSGIGDGATEEEAISGDTGLAGSITGILLRDEVSGGVGLAGGLTGIRLSEFIDGDIGLSGALSGLRLVRDASGSVGLTGAMEHPGGTYNRTALGELGITGEFEKYLLRQPLDGEVGLAGLFDTYRERFRSFDGAFALSGTFSGFNFSRWLRPRRKKIVRRYSCVLTGDADGQTDLTLPIKSFQARLRQATPTHLGVVLPGTSYAAEINLRTNGDLIVYSVYYINGVAALTEQIAAVDLESVRVDDGSRNGSITLSGHRTETYATKITTLEGVNYRRLDQGEYTIRCLPDMYARPGDTAKYDSDEFEIGRISWYVAVGQQTFEVTGQ